MTAEIERQLRLDAARTAAYHAARPIPDAPALASALTSPRRRMRVVLATAAAVAILVAVIAVLRLGERQTIAPAAPLPTPSDSPAPTNATSEPTNLSVAETTSATTETESAASSTVGTAPSDPVGGQPPAAGLEAFHAALDSIPDGYRVVAARTQQTIPSAQVGDGSWSATYVRGIVSGEALGYIQASIVPLVADDPYNGLTTTGTDVQVGAFTGRWTDVGQFPGFATFAAPIGNTWLVMVGGRASEDDVVSMISTMRVDPSADPPITDARPPDGFTLVHEGDPSDQQPSQSSTIVYAKGNAQETAITIIASTDPARPAIMTALGPDLPRTVDINDSTGILVGGMLTFDINPTLQVSITVGGPQSWAQSEDIDLLAALARSVVTIDNDTFDQYQQATQEDPFRPTDGDCESYITFSNPLSDTGTPTPDGTINVPTPGTITVDVTTTQPLANIDFFIQGLGKLTPIGHLDTLKGTENVTLTWDGIIDGQPAAAAPYPRIAVRADPADPTAPDVCNRHSDEPHLSEYSLPTYDYSGDFTIGAAFVVQEP